MLASLFLTLSVLALGALPVSAQTEQTCTCFCNTKTGAFKISDLKETSASCEQACKDGGYTVAVCAKTLRQFPSNNSLCFDAAACANQKGTLAKYQAPECPTGWTYCFPDTKKSEVQLSTQIGNLKTVGDIGTYVQAVYQYLLGAAILFSVVMIIIGGLQYALGAGMSEQISKAKGRIKNGVVGLILLFCAVLIMQIVNPQVLKLEVPRPSMVRQVDLSQNSCEKLEAAGYTLQVAEGSTTECGGVAEVKSGPNGASVPDGLTCAYTTCAEGSCVSQGLNTPGQCIECRYVSKDNPDSPAVPSPKLCFGMEIVRQKQMTSAWTGKKYVVVESANYCSYQSGGILNTSQGNSIIGGLDADGCFETVLNCDLIKECDDYDDKVTVYYYDDSTLKSNELDNIYPIMLGQVCVADPCGAHYLENKDKCEWNGNDACD